MDELIIVSSDGHAQMPPELWPDYLESRYHEFLPRLYEEADVYPGAIWPLTRAVLTLPGLEEEHTTGGYRGVYDARVRLAEMDREGISVETIYAGDHRKTELMFNIMNGVYPFDAWDAGARGHNRWVVDEFGLADGRFLLAGAIGSCSDIDATVAELEWIAEHGFVGTFCPGFLSHPALPPLFDGYWDPFWSVCADRGLGVFVHAGFGWMQGDVYPEVERIYTHWKSTGGSDGELMAMLTTEIFNGEFFADVKPRRPMWQLMLGGVFDRHPELKFVLTEVRADWIPALLRHLDAIFEERRAELPAARRPSEYWSEQLPRRRGRSCIAPKSTCATRSASRPSRSDAITRTPRALGRTRSSSCVKHLPVCPSRSCGSCSARTRSGSSASTAPGSPTSRRLSVPPSPT